ncbi:MAG: serine hydrolase [Anaerolineae bacterium]|nr:serine hydrolase [Anaerolineae bacterium]
MTQKSIALLLLSAILLGLAGCGGKAAPTALASAAPTAAIGAASTTPAIALTPYVSQHFGLNGVAPEGWTELAPGSFYRGVPPQDMVWLAAEFYPGMTAGWAIAAQVLPVAGLAELPPSTGTVRSPAFTWTLYSFDVPVAGYGKLPVDLALAESSAGVYLVALAAPGQEYAALHDSVFVPAVDALAPAAFDRRDKLTAAELGAPGYQGDGPVNNAYFAPLGQPAQALHALEGVLTVPEFTMQHPVANGQIVRSSESTFPGFSVEFFTYDDYLVPALRDEILPSPSKTSSWRIILSPGKVWSEPGDGGKSRASFPFALVGEYANEAHNGLATFLYDDKQVSSFHLQVVQETCAWNRTDFWGQSPVDYLPGSVKNRETLAAQFAAELSAQVPIRPWSDLAQKADLEMLNTFNGGVPALEISATGLVWDGAIYLQPCYTRYGPFPYCRFMRHGVFSVTKSMGAAIAMLRLAQKYGPEVFDLKIKDYVQVTAKHDGWDEVTFGDALNMATGIGDKPDLKAFTGEEDEARFNEFLDASSAQDKLDVCFSYGDYPWGPGEIARYNSINTFVLSVAMNNLLKSKEGADADIWDMIVEEVYKPIGIQHAPIIRTIESDGSRGAPIFGYGLYPTVEDVAKVAALYHSGGLYQGQQLLYADRLAEALYQVAGVGLPTADTNQYGQVLYNLSFWSEPYRTATGQLFQVPYMSGFGGNHVVLMPNGMTAFRFSDAHIYGVSSMVKVADAIVPFPAP